MAKTSILIVALPIIVIALAIVVFVPQPSDCRLQVETRTGYPAFASVNNVPVSVQDGPSGVTDAEGRLELQGVACGRNAVVEYGGGSWKTATTSIPSSFLLGPRDLGYAPVILVVQPA